MKITVAPGDGIGPEVMGVTLEAFRAAGVPLRYERVALGREACDRGEETGIGPEARRSVEETGILLRGPVATPPGRGADYLAAAAARLWDVFATKHVYRMHRGVPAPLGVGPVGLTMVRESPTQEQPLGEAASAEDLTSDQPNSRGRWLRLHRYAFEVAERKGLNRVTCAHRARANRFTDRIFRSAFYEAAREFPRLAADDVAVDRLAHKLVTDPEAFDLIVLPDIAGDILTDLATGLVGGLGYAPHAQIGDDVSIFAPVHGPAEDIAGSDRANPTAQLLAGTMMLRHIGFTQQARTIEAALEETLVHMHRRPDVEDWNPIFRTSVFRAVLLSEIRNELRTGSGARIRRPKTAAQDRGNHRNRLFRSVLAEQLQGLA